MQISAYIQIVIANNTVELTLSASTSATCLEIILPIACCLTFSNNTVLCSCLLKSSLGPVKRRTEHVPKTLLGWAHVNLDV